MLLDTYEVKVKRPEGGATVKAIVPNGRGVIATGEISRIYDRRSAGGVVKGLIAEHLGIPESDVLKVTYLETFLEVWLYESTKADRMWVRTLEEEAK